MYISVFLSFKKVSPPGILAIKNDNLDQITNKIKAILANGPISWTWTTWDENGIFSISN